MARVSRRSRGLLVALALLMALNVLWPAPRVRAQAPQPADYTYGECRRADAAAIEAEMTMLARNGLQAGRMGIALGALVDRNWRETGADVTFDTAVDNAVARIHAEKGYWERLWSGWSAEAAEEMAGQVAAYAFADPALTAKLDELSNAIAQDLVVELEAYAAQSASSALLCLQSYVGEHYSATLFEAFQDQVSRQFAAELDLSGAAAVEVSPLDLHVKGLTGIGVIVATEITRRVAVALAEKIAARLAGKIVMRVLGRLGSSVIPYVGWAVGVGLLVWDLWEGSQGALPAIRDAMQAEEVKQEVRAEITLAVDEALDAEVETMAAAIGVELAGQWQGFCADHGVVCDLAATNAHFRALLDATPLTDLPRLVMLVDFFWVEMGAEPLYQALDNGVFLRLLLLPPEADTILTWTGSPQMTLVWADLAGDNLPRVLELELYQAIDPVAWDELSLAALLAIGDNALIHKLVTLTPADLHTLLQLPTADLRQMAATATVEELTWMAQHLAGLPAEDAVVIGSQVAQGDVTIAALQTPPTPVPAVGDVPAVDVATSTWMDQMPGWLAPLNNGVVIAAGFMVILLILVGLVLAYRRDHADATGHE